MEATRISRWSDEPIIGRNGKPRLGIPTERDEKIGFPLLMRHGLLDLGMLHAFMGGNYQALRRHYGLLARKPNRYLYRPSQAREHAEANYLKGIFGMRERGEKHMKSLGHDVKSHGYIQNFAHGLMIGQVGASIALGASQSPHTILPWKELKAGKKMPRETKESKHPFAIPIGKGETITPDDEPFVVAYDTNTYRFFPGFEADCGTEPLHSNDSARSSIRAKFAAYLRILEKRIYTQHFGADTFMIPFITNSETRMYSMMALLDSMQPGEFAASFIFKHVPSFHAHGDRFRSTGHMFIEPWKRAAGLPEFYLNQA